MVWPWPKSVVSKVRVTCKSVPVQLSAKANDELKRSNTLVTTALLESFIVFSQKMTGASVKAILNTVDA
jgi:hypothetical protein